MFLIWVYLMFPRSGIPAGILHKRCGILRRATDLKTPGAHLLSLALPQAAWWSAWHCSRPLPCIAMSEEQHLFFRSNRPSCLSLPPIGSTYCGAFFRAIQLLCQPLHMQPICGETRSSLLGQTAANIEEKCFFIPLVKTARQPLSNPRHLLSRSDPSTARGSHLKYHHQIAHLRCLATQSQPQLHNKSEASTATQNSVSKQNYMPLPLRSQMKTTHKQISEDLTCGFFSVSAFTNTLAHSQGCMSPGFSKAPDLHSVYLTSFPPP